jgi:hypothetical protein
MEFKKFLPEFYLGIVVWGLNSDKLNKNKNAMSRALVGEIIAAFEDIRVSY